jgi:hypothetical protein
MTPKIALNIFIFFNYFNFKDNTCMEILSLFLAFSLFDVQSVNVRSFLTFSLMMSSHLTFSLSTLSHSTFGLFTFRTGIE